MSIRIISVGKKHESWVADGILRYQERLRQPFNVEWSLLPHSALTGSRALQDESERILNYLNDRDYVILLDETGKNLDSSEFSQVLSGAFNNSRSVTIVIGGAYGVDAEVKRRCNFVWSLSKLVFPHQLVRLILSEQIYRAQQIALSHPYHHA